MRIWSILRFLVVLGVLAAIGSAFAAMVMRGRLASRGGPEDDELELVTIFEPLDLTSRASALRRVSATTWYGGGTLDLRPATLDAAGATLDARTVFGGLRIVVPATWRVELDSRGFAGGAADGRDQALVDSDGPTLTVRSRALFGGLGIVSETPDRAQTDLSVAVA